MEKRDILFWIFAFLQAIAIVSFLLPYYSVTGIMGLISLIILPISIIGIEYLIYSGRK